MKNKLIFSVIMKNSVVYIICRNISKTKYWSGEDTTRHSKLNTQKGVVREGKGEAGRKNSFSLEEFQVVIGANRI